MYIVLFLLFGLIVGALARLIVPGSAPGGWLTSMVIGVIGSFLGGFIGRALGAYSDYRTTGGFVASLLGAIVVTMAYQAFNARRRIGP